MDTAADDDAPALPAEPRPAHESTSLPTDYPAEGGVPQCLAVATKPVKLAQGVWEVQAGLPMEAFWCVNGPDEVTKYNFTPANKGYGKAKTRKKAALAAVLQFHDLQRTAADTLALTDAGRAVPGDTCVWSATWACTGAGNCRRQCGGAGACLPSCSGRCRPREGACSFRVLVTATREQVERGVWHVAAPGSHVQRGTAPDPPQATELRWSGLAKAWAVDKSRSANVAPVVVSTMNRAEVGPGGSGKHVVRHKALAKAKEYHARLARGVAMTDGAARNQNRAGRGRTQHLRAF